MPQTKTATPIHLGIILDGNRRWAKANGIPQLEGHRKGYENLKTIGTAALDRGIKYVSAYVFSTENWKRSQVEVKYLMRLLVWILKNEVDELNKKGVRVRIIGSKSGLDKKVVKACHDAEEITKHNTKGTLALCFNYGGYQEITDAVKNIVADGLKPEDITSETISRHLYASDIPPVDFIIRTSGEQRLSNFMLWRAAYSELYFVDKHWPAFTVEDLDEALKEYANRQRRFGA
jgi:undecaprenyl diphosphate synthase